jgi:hypothetical protein
MISFNPHISVDCVIFGFRDNKLHVLLINRDKADTDSHNSRKKLPGSLIRQAEELENSAHRVLNELTGLDHIYLKQFGVFGKPDRLTKVKEDLDWLMNFSGLIVNRVISIAYYSVINIEMINGIELSKEFGAQWYPVSDIPSLIFDHKEIVDHGLESLKKEFLTEPLCFELLPEKFTLNQLQIVYESILDMKLDNRNFRKKLTRLEYIKALDEWQKGVAHKPARFYGFDRSRFDEFKQTHLGFII